MLQKPPIRSQSFRHRPRPNILFNKEIINNNDITDNNNEIINNNNNNLTPERRRSTPTINRRASLRGGGGLRYDINTNRLDTWPEPKQMSEAEERFLRLPDSADYTRVRQFNIDSKGAVISRGDSFRRKRINLKNEEIINNNEDEQIINERSSTHTSSGSSNISNICINTNRIIESSPEFNEENNNNILIGCTYKICVLGESDVGKTCLISQFISSSAYSDLNDYYPQYNNRSDNSVSINIGGHECELKFLEINLNEIQNNSSSSLINFIGNFHLFLIVYSIDRKASFKIALKIIEQFRSIGCSSPIILVGNKADLERKRAVMEIDMYTFDIAHFEISVALNHDIDDLLVGIVAQIKDSFQMSISTENENLINKKKKKTKLSMTELSSPKDTTTEDFQAAIRRFSRRKKRQMHVTSTNSENGKCLNLFSKLRILRKGSCSS